MHTKAGEIKTLTFKKCSRFLYLGVKVRQVFATLTAVMLFKETSIGTNMVIATKQGILVNFAALVIWLRPS